MENNGKAKRDFYMMMRWAIRTMFQNNPNAIVSVRELEKQLDDAWFDLSNGLAYNKSTEQ